jgi:hypothetical protein
MTVAVLRAAIKETLYINTTFKYTTKKLHEFALLEIMSPSLWIRLLLE